MKQHTRRFDIAMRVITFPALALLILAPLAAMWGLYEWGAAGKAVITVVAAWFGLAMLAALLWHRSGTED